MLNMLLGYADDYKGSIRIDDTEIREIQESSLNDIMSVIHQNIFLFDDTIKNNITLYKEYEDELVNKIIEVSGLNSVVENKKLGLETNVGENGCYLSGGEKQRIAIAKALIKKTQILILDEATSSLDNETSYEIEKFLVSLKEFTLIVVTHKLIGELLKKYDEIIVLKDGHIEEAGTFDELINQKKYFYYLYNITRDK